MESSTSFWNDDRAIILSEHGRGKVKLYRPMGISVVFEEAEFHDILNKILLTEHQAGRK